MTLLLMCVLRSKYVPFFPHPLEILHAGQKLDALRILDVSARKEGSSRPRTELIPENSLLDEPGWVYKHELTSERLPAIVEPMGELSSNPSKRLANRRLPARWFRQTAVPEMRWGHYSIILVAGKYQFQITLYSFKS